MTEVISHLYLHPFLQLHPSPTHPLHVYQPLSPASFCTRPVMAPQIFAQFLVTDDLTILLGLIAATVFLLSNFYRPQPLVHPILLGRQSDIARVRNPTESAVYRV